MIAADRIPPHDLDTEQACLGAAMLSPDAALVLPAASDFFRPSHRLVAEAIHDLALAGKPVDALTVADALNSHLGEAGGKAYLLTLQGAVTVASHAERHAAIVRRHALSRRLIDAGTRIVTQGYEGAGDEALEAAEAIFSEAVSVAAAPVRLGALLSERGGRLTERKRYLIPPLFPNVHLHFGDLLVLGGRPSTGKSSIAAQWGEFFALTCPVRVYSLEMDPTDWAERFMSRYSPFSTDKLDDGLTADEAALVMSSVEHLTDLPMDVVDGGGWSLAALTADMRRFARSGGGVVVLDYLALAVNEERGQKRHEAMRGAIRRLKTTARQTGLLIVSLSQISREVKHDSGKLRPPMMADLRETGATEEDADDVVLLHHYEEHADARDTDARTRFADGGYEMGERHVLAQVHFAKLRRGRKFASPCWWDGEDYTYSRATAKIEDALPGWET